MYLSKKFKKFGAGAAVLGLAVASCQLVVGCSDSNVNGDVNGGATGEAGNAGKAGGASHAGASSGGRAGATGAAGETEPGGGAAGERNGGENNGGESNGGAGGTSGAAGTSGASGTSGAGTGGTSGSSGSAGTAGKAGSGGTAGMAGSGGSAGSAGNGGSAGSAGSGGSAGNAGSAGSGGSAGNAGSAGNGGSAGNAGSAGGGPVCGNNIKETGEVCDPKFTANDCGADCKAITSAECFTCENDPAYCQDFVNCSSIAGNAAANTPAAGVPKANLCNEVLDCVRDSGCASSGNAIIKCYCGTANSTDCQSGGANGLCKTQLERGLETTSFAVITQRLKSPQYGGGVAMARVDCDQQACKTECGL